MEDLVRECKEMQRIARFRDCVLKIWVVLVASSLEDLSSSKGNDLNREVMIN